MERWRKAFEERGLKVSRKKTEYLQVGGKDQGMELHMQEEVVKKVEHFKYLGSVVSRNGSSEEVVRRRTECKRDGRAGEEQRVCCAIKSYHLS